MAQSATLHRYFTQVRGYPALTREEEQALVVRFRTQGDEAARETLIAAHLRYVVAIALKYQRYGVPIEELDRGTRFVTYAAYWIRAYVLNHVIRSWSLVGVGSGALRSKMFFRLRRERVKIANLVGEGQEAENMLAQSLGLPEATVSAMLRRLDARDVSLDAKPIDGSHTSLGDLLATPGSSQEEFFAASELDVQRRVAVKSALSELDERERYIVEKRLMADREDELSLAEIGRQLGVSRERARQLEVRAKRKLKSKIEDLSRRAGDWLSLDSAA